MDRRLALALEAAFILAVVLEAWLASGVSLGLTTCPPFTGAVNLRLNTSGSMVYVGGPLFSGHQLSLAPGSTGLVTVRMSSGFNISQYLELINISSLSLGPFGADNYVVDMSRAYRTSTGWNALLVPPNETGITVRQVSFVKTDDHNYSATYEVIASPFARLGTYQAPMFFNGWCSNYYLTIGGFPYMGTLDGTPQPITFLLPLIPFILIGVAVFIYGRAVVARRSHGAEATS